MASVGGNAAGFNAPGTRAVQARGTEPHHGRRVMCVAIRSVAPQWRLP